MSRKKPARVLLPKSPERGGWRVIRIGDNGKRRSKLFPTKRLRDIEAECARREIEASATRTIGEAFDEYQKFLTAKGNKGIERTAWSIEVFFHGVEFLHELTPARCEGLYESLRTRPRERVKADGTITYGKPYANDSHRGALREAKTFLRWCVRQGDLESNPAESIEGIGKLRPRGKSLGANNYRPRIKEARAWYAKVIELATAGDEGAVACLLALLCGMRASEVVSRRIRDLDCDEVPADIIHVEDRKNDEDITVEVPEVLRVALLALVGDREEGFIFPWDNSAGHRGRWFVLRSANRVSKAAGLPPLTAHALRGLLATVSADRGMAGHLVAATLGNDERVMSRAYAAPGAVSAGGRRRGLAVLEGGKR